MSSDHSKHTLSGSERQQKYKENNKKAVELNTIKQNFARSKLDGDDVNDWSDDTDDDTNN